MTERSPPFTALRAVEAASRHRSFTAAARELQITHSAVSQSIRRLETELGARLFERKGGAMEPSEAALRLAQTYSEAEEALSRTLREILGPQGATALSVVMPAAFGRLWFAGKIGRLSEALPDVEVQVRTQGDDPDADIRLAWLAKAGKDSLCELVHLPLCAPDQAGRFDSVAAIVGGPLIADSAGGWTAWAARWTPGVKPPRAHVFDDAGMALEAAAQGGGVVLSNVFAAEAYLASGRLTALGFEAPGGEWLDVQTRSEPGVADAAERLVLWLRLEVRRSLALVQGLTKRRQDVS
ncbi:LysR family transcriptional regulator [Caulobacter soli]|uniref:LysR family transcriptional regulator n=1 Tax=Caulobacter soli TaxID=2708539 RepID=UPI0013E9C90B|nr:LysR family transcriptional regulator [Caulobacter soli]